MRYSKDELYRLLPTIYRQRDAEMGKPLEALIEVVSKQVGILESDIEKLQDNWFIETCDPWVVPYIGDLVGAKLLRASEKTRISQRAWVGNTIVNRRRKGTVAALEQIASDVTGYPVKAIEFFQHIITTQNINHICTKNTTVDVRSPEKLELLDTPWNSVPHSVDVRNIKTNRKGYNIPNIGLFLWRTLVFQVRNGQAVSKENGVFSFDPLGLRTELHNNPQTEPEITHLAKEINVPGPIRRRALAENMQEYYGENKSIFISITRKDGTTKNIAADQIVVRDIAATGVELAAEQVAIDPVKGLLAFSEQNLQSVYVTYFYGLNGDIGAGTYSKDNQKTKEPSPKPELTEITGGGSSLKDKIEQWVEEKPNTPTNTSDLASPVQIFEIKDSLTYNGSLSILLSEKENVVIRAAGGTRPVLMKPDAVESPIDDEKHAPLITVIGKKGSSLTLQGLVIDGDIVLNPGDLASLNIVSSTIVPRNKSSLQYSANAESTSEGNNDNCVISVSKTLTGRIDMAISRADVKIYDSIVDCKSAYADLPSPSGNAIQCYKATMCNCTAFGEVKLELLEASNCIFTDNLFVNRLQESCLRFSYIPGLKIGYHCVSDSATLWPGGRVVRGVRPHFTSVVFGEPGYAQLYKDTPKEIAEGADNESEMGAFNDLFQPQRIKNLESCLDEYLPFGLDAGIFLVDYERVKL